MKYAVKQQGEFFLYMVLLSCIFFSTPVLTAQEYLHESSKWYTVRGDFFDNYYSVSTLGIAGDTMINDFSYHKIHGTANQLQLAMWSSDDTLFYYPAVSYHAGFIREESGKFYQWRNGEDQLLMDFNLELGSQVEGIFSTETIIQIDSFLLNTTYRKVFITDQGNEIYEGIGTKQGLFEGLSFLGDEGVGILLCYSHEELSYELNENALSDLLMTENCEEAFLITETEDHANSARISLYPNPVSDIIWLKMPGAQSGSYQIVNQLGQEVASGFFAQRTNQINLSLLPSGVYYLLLKFKEQHYSQIFVKIRST